MRLLPPATIPGPGLLISVDLPQHLLAEHHAAPLADPQTGRAESIAARLCKVFDSYDVPVTWALDRPQAAGSLTQPLARAARREIAVRYDARATATSPDAGLRRLLATIRELKTAGPTASTLLVRGTLRPSDFEALARAGINLLVTPEATQSSGGSPIQTLRFGMWRLGCSWRVPGQSGWLRSHLDGVLGRRGIDNTISRRTLFHIAIDAEALTNNARGTRSLERLLRHAARRRHEGSLRLLTLGDMAQRLAVAPANPACSILRSRAA